MDRWGVRTIRNGTVKFGGKLYVPNDPHHPYNGELDGQRWLFAKYDNQPLLAMWGDEKRYRASIAGDEAYDKDCERMEANVLPPRGEIAWYFWREKGGVK